MEPNERPVLAIGGVIIALAIVLPGVYGWFFMNGAAQPTQSDVDQASSLTPEQQGATQLKALQDLDASTTPAQQAQQQQAQDAQLKALESLQQK